MKTICKSDGNGNCTVITMPSDNKPKQKKAADPGHYLWPSNLPPYKLQDRKEAMVNAHPEWTPEQVALFWELNS